MVTGSVFFTWEVQAMRLVHITTAPQALGFLKGQVGYMRQRGFDVHAISSPGERLDEFAQRENVPVHAVEMLRAVSPGQDVLALKKLIGCTRRIRPHIVHAHTPKGGLLGALAAWLCRVPVRLYQMRGLPLLTATGYKRVLLRWSEKVACACAHSVLCNSHSVREAALEQRLCRPRKIKVLLHGSGQGVDAAARFNPAQLEAATRASVREQYDIPRDALVVGFVGRVVRDKGVDELVEAWQTLHRQFPGMHLLVVGPFEPQDPVSKQTEEALRTDPRIHLTGTDWDTPPLYAAMDMVALPTYREGFPNVPLEGAAMELPVVGTRVPGCVDAIEDGVTGTLVPPQDAVALADAIRAYAQDPELRRRHGQAGRERVLRDFRPQDIWEATFQEYLRLLRERGLPAPDQAGVATHSDEQEGGV